MTTATDSDKRKVEKEIQIFEKKVDNLFGWNMSKTYEQGYCNGY